MPFPNQTLRFFNRQNILAIHGNPTGVYGIVSGNKVIYVGKGDIKQRLLAHLNGDNPSITALSPTHWVDEVTSLLDNREKELIIEFNPPANKRLG